MGGTMTEKYKDKCWDCACYHAPTDLCVYKREKVDCMQNACEYFIWD